MGRMNRLCPRSVTRVRSSPPGTAALLFPSCTAFPVSGSLRCVEALDKSIPPAVNGAARPEGGSPCASISSSTTSPAFSITRKRRKSFPSETQVRRGDRVVHGDVELTEKLGRNDLCPCGSGRRFQTLLHGTRTLRRHQPQLLFSGSDGPDARARLMVESMDMAEAQGQADSTEA